MKNTLKKYLEEFEYSEDYKAAFLPAMDKLLESRDARSALHGHIEEYKAGNLNWEAIGADAVKYAPMVGQQNAVVLQRTHCALKSFLVLAKPEVGAVVVTPDGVELPMKAQGWNNE